MLRPSLPGVPFHVTARTQWQEPLFHGIEGEVAELIRGSIDRSDAHLLSYAVMANHIHVIAVQGRRPLSALMQPLLRRIALLCRRSTAREGHVFHGRFHHSACHDPEYFRSMIAYVHLNPVRAGICLDPGNYAWTSHRDYARGCSVDALPRYVHGVERGLRIFARRSDHRQAQWQRAYQAFVRWRVDFDDYLSDENSWRPAPRPPLSIGGDLHWHREYGSASTLRLTGASQPPARIADLRDHLSSLLDEIAPDLPLSQLCSGGRGRPLVSVRNQIIARAISAGYTTTKLATFLNISPSAVSGMRARMRETKGPP